MTERSEHSTLPANDRADAGGEQGGAVEQLLAAVAEASGIPEPPESAVEKARGYGAARGAAGARIGELVAEVLAAAGEGSGAARALASAAAEGWEAQRAERRERWLSQLVHDAKNPLNTILNALWLVRGRSQPTEEVVRFLDMIGRAARKIEASLADLRDLERRSIASAPPPRPGSR